MKVIWRIIESKRTVDVLLLFVLLFFILYSLFRNYSEGSLGEILIGNDDQNSYVNYGLDIKNNGLLISSVDGVYGRPGGSLYNYFIALCFILFGESTTPIYILQGMLLGFSVAIIFLSFRNKMKNITGFLFLTTLFIFALLDVY